MVLHPSHVRNRRHSELRQVEKEIRAEFVNSEVSKKKQEVMDGVEKSRGVMKKWVGVSMEEVFNCWRNCAGLSKKFLRKEHRERARDERLRYEDELAAYKLKKLELKKWVLHWDEFNDVPKWVNTESNESSYEKPNQPKYPLMPASLVDTTGKPLSPNATRRNRLTQVVMMTLEWRDTCQHKQGADGQEALGRDTR
jgi:hypothetical protein